MASHNRQADFHVNLFDRGKNDTVANIHQRLDN